MATRQDERVTLHDVQIIFRNFSGRAGMYNKAGDRGFAVKLDPKWAEELTNRGWNVKYLRPRDEEEAPQAYISVKIKFDGPRPPKVFMISPSTKRRTQLDESTVDLLDFADILQVDLMLSPYAYTINDRAGISVYLDSIYVTIIEDELAVHYQNMEFATVDGPMMQPATGPDPEPPRS